jgi:hypothetical protein
LVCPKGLITSLFQPIGPFQRPIAAAIILVGQAANPIASPFTYQQGISMIDIMRAISLNLPDDLLDTSTRCADALGLSRAEYIRRAIVELNRQSESEIRAQRLVQASLRVRAESESVLAEFEDSAPDLEGF